MDCSSQSSEGDSQGMDFLNLQEFAAAHGRLSTNFSHYILIYSAGMLRHEPSKKYGIHAGEEARKTVQKKVDDGRSQAAFLVGPKLTKPSDLTALSSFQRSSFHATFL
jgi:hypothetical protein